MQSSQQTVKGEYFDRLNIIQKKNPSSVYKVKGKLDANFYKGTKKQNDGRQFLIQNIDFKGSEETKEKIYN